MSISNFHYLGKETAFAGYQKIRGIHLNKQIYTSLDFKVRQHIAKSIASFFTELHQSALKKDPEWRWGIKEEKSVWYDSIRPFRQEKAGDWSLPFAIIVEELSSIGQGSKIPLSKK